MRLKEKYQKQVIPAMMEKFGYKNRMAVPTIEKIVLNAGIGRLSGEQKGEGQKKIQEQILDALTLIAGQRAVLTYARKSIAGFKIRKGQPVGVKVTLRGDKMWDFLERVIHIALPRSRDFRGISPNAIDEQGNLTLGFKESTVFPEITPEEMTLSFGFEVTVVTTAKNKKEGEALLRLLGMPLKKI